jgi:hypothetical protein
VARRRAARRAGAPRRRRPAPDPAYAAPDPADNQRWAISEYWAPPAVAAADRRGLMRREGNPTAVLVATADRDTPERAHVLNRTSGGLRLALKHALPVGTTLWLRAGHAPADTPWAEVSVRWCEEADGCFEIGCQFQGQLPWSLLLLFG